MNNEFESTGLINTINSLTTTDKEELTLTDEERRKIDSYKKDINFSKASDIIQYGVGSQSRLSGFSDQVLKQIRIKDAGETGELLTDLTINLRNFDNSLNKKSFFSFFETLKGKIARIKTEYSTVEKNIGNISIKLEKHYQILLKDINLFDKLYKENQLHYKDLSLYIIAGEEILKEATEVLLPRVKTEAELSGDEQQAQNYKNLEQQVDRFDKKVHDLKLSKMISLQLAPQIRFVQNNSTILMDKIQSIIINTLPLWKNQMVLSLGIAHSQQALEAQRAVTDATNKLLQRNSEMLKESTTQIAIESQRGILDMETLRNVNQNILQTLDDVMRIQEEGKISRQNIEIELTAAETELKNRLLNK